MRRPGLAETAAARRARAAATRPVTPSKVARTAVLAALTASLIGGPASCARAPACDGLACAAACPRSAAIDASARCVCDEGDALMLGACVPPAIAAAFCGPAATAASGGCVFRSCGARESLDVATGVCTPRASLLHGGAIACGGAFAPLVENGRAACVPPDATCPRDATFHDGACVRPPGCPAGTLAQPSTQPSAGATSCRPLVTTGGRSGTRVDVGSWAALALGVDGGRGSSWLCQPLEQRPSVFASDLRAARGTTGHADAGAGTNAGAGANAGAGTNAGAGAGVNAGVEGAAASMSGVGALAVRIAVAATFPDEDISRLHATVRVRDGAGLALAPGAEALVTSTVTSLLELLRSLGGEASAGAVGLDVTCTLEPAR